MKLRRHKCKSLKEFNKIFRKYLKYYAIPRFRDNYRRYWYTWIWFDIIGLEELKTYSWYKPDRNFPLILNDVIQNYNWSFKHKNGDVYALRGVEISNEDYYYIYINIIDTTKPNIFTSCVGHWKEAEHIYGENSI